MMSEKADTCICSSGLSNPLSRGDVPGSAPVKRRTAIAWTLAVRSLTLACRSATSDSSEAASSDRVSICDSAAK